MTDTAITIGREMAAEEVRSFLTSNNHGVLSMGVENRGYGPPMSFHYDEENDRIILGFLNAPGSKKRQFVAAAEEVTFTTYHFEDVDTWASVIVTGSIHPCDEPAISERQLPVFFSRVDEATGDVRWIDADELGREWYEIQITEVTGRYSGQFPHNVG